MKKKTQFVIPGFASLPWAGAIISWLSHGARQGMYPMEEVTSFCKLQGITFKFYPMGWTSKKEDNIIEWAANMLAKTSQLSDAELEDVKKQILNVLRD